ncbi:LuxR C-terminal-related transcriptional regulator, partial [Chloroflexota bacterium]
ILSMRDSKLSGTAITLRIKRSYPSITIILVAESSDETQIFTAMKSGASACINKDTEPSYLLDMLRVIMQGSQPIIDSLLLPEIAVKTAAEFEEITSLSGQLDDMLANLSPKEAEVLTLIAGGSNMEQIVAQLTTSESNVRKQLKTIVNKLVSNEQAKALLQAAQRGMPTLMARRPFEDTPNGEYVTKEEFNEFKEHLMGRLKSFIGELA